MSEKTGKKPRGRAGESIAEVLVALLISAMGILLLATMLRGTAEIIDDSDRLYQNYIKAENTLEAQIGTARTSHVGIRQDGETVKLTDESGYSVPVLCYSNMSGGQLIVSYRVNSDEP